MHENSILCLTFLGWSLSCYYTAITTEIKPKTVRKAREKYRDEQAGDIADRTLHIQERTSGHSMSGETHDLEHIGELSGRDFHEFRLARKKEIVTSTLSMQMSYVYTLTRRGRRELEARRELENEYVTVD